MVISAIYTSLYSGASFRAQSNYAAGQRLIDKAAELVSALEATENADAFDLDALFKSDNQKAQETLDDLIKQSIKEITDLRRSFGITEAAGQNKPLDELFSAIKGSVCDSSI